jgi:biotin synthase
MNVWENLCDKALAGETLTRDEALSILTADDAETPQIVAAAERARRAHFGDRIKLNYLVNVKSGLCPEDCHYCTQSKDSTAPIEKYNMLSADEIIASAEKGTAVGASRACLVASGRGPSARELDKFCDAVRAMKEKNPNVEVCACLGLLMDGQAQKLKDAGVDAYNHNLNTSEAHYERICQTHAYNDRVDTVDKARESGMQACSGVLAGMGETNEDLVDVGLALRRQNVQSVPINFLISVDGTPLQKTNNLTPLRCLRILAMFRLINPSAELRIAGGREVHLRQLQPLGLLIANSIFIGDYLTTKGQSARADLEMIRDLGLKVLNQPDDFLETTLGAPASGADIKAPRRGAETVGV